MWDKYRSVVARLVLAELALYDWHFDTFHHELEGVGYGGGRGGRPFS